MRSCPDRVFKAFIASLLLAGPALAVDPNDPERPPTTPTTTECAEGMIWDPESATCRAPRDAGVSDDARYAAVRELAYLGRLAGARTVLSAMTEGPTDRVLTMRGFLLRESGEPEAAQAAYAAALAINPDNILARSYRGQGLIEAGDLEGARAELSEIRRRGGRDTWAEVSLRLALGSGTALAY